MKYAVIYVSDSLDCVAAHKLAEKTNEYIKNGWEPLGGVSTSIEHLPNLSRCYIIHMYQAVIKK